MKTRFITFYSFKGGVGRTQALANVAVALVNRGNHVVVVDMDMESPGLHMFFESPEGEAIAPARGVLEFAEDCLDLPITPPDVRQSLVRCTHARCKPGSGSLRLVAAGNLGGDYARRVSAFSWYEFYHDHDGYRFMELLRAQLADAGADFVLIDSRTGVNDVGQICTFQLPDTLVALFALHGQGIEGTRRLAEAISQSQKEDKDQGRVQRMLLVPARVEESSLEDSKERWLSNARKALEGTHELLTEFDDRIPHSASSAFGEQIVVGGAQSPLSNAYERLVARITNETPDSQVLGLAEIRDELVALKAELRGVIGERQGSLPASLDLLGRWVTGMMERRVAILGRLDVVRRAAARLHSDGGPDLALAATSSLDTTDDAVTEESRLSLAIQAIDLWKERRLHEVGERLLRAAEGDEIAAHEYRGPLAQLIAAGHFHELERRLPAIEAALQNESLPALLRRGTLDKERLRKSRPAQEERNRWLDAMIQRWVTEPPDSDPSRALENLLGLLLAENAPLSGIHWTAYDILCAYVRDNLVVDRRVFAEIGVRFWHIDLERIFADTVGLVNIDLSYLAGVDGQVQLARMAGDGWPSVAALVDRARTGLVGCWVGAEGGRKRVRDLLRRRPGDSLLKSAIESLGDDAPLEAKIGLLASWMRSCEVPESERVIAGSLLTALIRAGMSGEAFYLLGALARRSPDIATKPEFAFVWVSVLAGAPRSASLWQVLSSDFDVLHLLLGSRAGRVLLVALGAQWLTISDGLAAVARTQVLHEDESKESLPETVLSWLKELERERWPDRDRVNEAEKAIASVKQIAQRTIYASWVPSIHWEQEFAAEADRALEQVLDALGTNDAKHVANTLDRNAWSSATSKKLRDKGLRTTNPDRKAEQILERNFADLADALQTLASLVPESGATLRAEIDRIAHERRAREDLLRWIDMDHSVNAGELAAAAAVRLRLTQENR